MAYVPVPKDLTKVKTKVMFNLTKRQLICFTGGALIGVPLFFLLRKPTGNSVAAMCMMLVMLPFFMLAMYEKHGQPLEKIVGNILKVAVIRPKQRPYQTNNFYAVLKRQEMLDKEVYDIVHRNKKMAASEETFANSISIPHKGYSSVFPFLKMGADCCLAETIFMKCHCCFIIDSVHDYMGMTFSEHCFRLLFLSVFPVMHFFQKK